jgi:hypothetical protein
MSYTLHEQHPGAASLVTGSNDNSSPSMSMSRARNKKPPAQMTIIDEAHGIRFAQRIFPMSDQHGQNLESRHKRRSKANRLMEMPKMITPCHLLSHKLKAFLAHGKRWNKQRNALVEISMEIQSNNIVKLQTLGACKRIQTIFYISLYGAGLGKLITSWLIPRSHHRLQ